MKEIKWKLAWYRDSETGEPKRLNRYSARVTSKYNRNISSLDKNIQDLRSMFANKSYLPDWASYNGEVMLDREQAMEQILDDIVYGTETNKNIVSAIEEEIYEKVESQLNQLWYQSIADSLKEAIGKEK